MASSAGELQRHHEQPSVSPADSENNISAHALGVLCLLPCSWFCVLLLLRGAYLWRQCLCAGRQLFNYVAKGARGMVETCVQYCALVTRTAQAQGQQMHLSVNWAALDKWVR